MSDPFAPPAPEEPVVTPPVVEEPVVVESEPEPPAPQRSYATPVPNQNQIPDPAPVADVTPVPETVASLSPAELTSVARDVIAGRWGNGDDRKSRLTESAFDAVAVQQKVNELLDAGSGEHATYTVQAGESLSSIAARLNYKGGWQALESKNRAVVGPNASDLRPGQVLSL